MFESNTQKWNLRERVFVEVTRGTFHTDPNEIRLYQHPKLRWLFNAVKIPNRARSDRSPAATTGRKNTRVFNKTTIVFEVRVKPHDLKDLTFISACAFVQILDFNTTFGVKLIKLAFETNPT